MSAALVDLSDPMSSSEFATLDTERLSEIAARHQKVAEFLRDEKFAALLIQQPVNFAWLTCGSSNQRGGSTGITGSLFVTPEARVLVSSNIDTAQFFELELGNMGFQLKERPWYEPRNVILGDLCRGRCVISDQPMSGTTELASRVTELRQPQGDYDKSRLREAGRIVTHAVEATARGLTKGRTEAEIAGEVSHRLLKHGVQPERLQVLADGRGRRFRRWKYDDSPVTSYCSISAIGRYRGLYVGSTRTVSVGEPVPELLKSFQPAALIHATGIFFSQHNWIWSEVWNRVHRIYEKCQVENEWRLADQASLVEYEYGSIPLMPSTDIHLNSGTAIHWHPSVGPVLMGDTVYVTNRGTEVLTASTDWPVVPVSVKGTNIPISAIMVVPE